MSEYPYPLPVIEERNYQGERSVVFTNLYKTHYGNISEYDLEQYNRWTEEPTDENKNGLPYEITSDDRRAEMGWNPEEVRAAYDQLGKILAKWDGELRCRCCVDNECECGGARLDRG